MTFIFVLQSVLIVFALLEIAAVDYPRIQKQLYVIAFLFTAVWCTAKYAYGPDICIYIPYYRLTTTDLWYNLTHPIHGYNYEKGFVVVCSICKMLDLTYWEFTAVISVFYFVTLAFLLRNLKHYRIIALLVIVFLDNNLFLVELRQCLAVSFFYIAIMAFKDKRYLISAIAALLMLTMHKTAFLVLFLTVLFFATRGLKIETKSYILLGLLIIGLMMIPLAPVMDSVIDLIPMPASYAASAKHHLLVGKSIQKVLVIYVCTILILAWYKRKDDDNQPRHWMMWCCVAVLAFFFPYWFMLNRFRSYFLPFLTIYTIDILCGQTSDFIPDSIEKLPRQLYTLVIIGYIAVSTLLISHTNKTLRYPTDRVSLVFERINHGEEELTERQLKQAIKYWEYDYADLIKKGQAR